MVGTITPLVEEARRRRGGAAATAIALVYVASSVLGAAALAAGLHVAANAANVGRDRAAAATVAVVGAYLLLTLATPRLRLPMRDKQVPLEWRSRMGPLTAAIVYSAILGAALFTRINSVAIYLIPVAAALAPSWTLALAPAVLYGFARAASVVAPSVALADRYYEDVEGVMRWLTHQRRVWTAVQAVAVAATAVAATAVTLTGVGG